MRWFTSALSVVFFGAASAHAAYDPPATEAIAVAEPIRERPSTAIPDDELRVGTLRVGKILFLGNSITLNGPAPEIGWTGNWGMAAIADDLWQPIRQAGESKH